MTKEKLAIVVTEAAQAAKAGASTAESDALIRLARAISTSPMKNATSLVDLLEQGPLGENG